MRGSLPRMAEPPVSRPTHALSVLRYAAVRRCRDAKRWAIRVRLDLQDRRAGTRDPLLPPRRLGLPVPAPVLGERIVELIKQEGGLDRSSDVLDIGCGPGRIAVPLARWMSPSATYEGFDVMPKSIAWCRKAITPRYPNFRFQVADVTNGEYNPRGSQRASEYTFPYADASFDVALATSLFTHLKPFESQRYLGETARTLRPGGRLVGTWSCSTSASRRRSRRGSSAVPGCSWTAGRRCASSTGSPTSAATRSAPTTPRSPSS